MQEVFLLENKIGQTRLIGLDKLARHKDRVQVQVGHPRRREKLIDGASDAVLGTHYLLVSIMLKLHIH